MKLKQIICVGLMLLACTACAEEQRYISLENDLYWHVNAACGGELMLEADNMQEHFACPVCVPETFKKGIDAVERGGTIILRMTDEWMANRKDIGSVFGFSPVSSYEGEAASEMLTRYLHGDAYNAFMGSYAETGKAEGMAYEPDIYPENAELFMNQRHIGGAWYVTMRPARVSGDSIEIYLRFFAGKIWMEDEVLQVDFSQEWGDTDYELKFSEKSGKGKTFSKDYGDFSIAVHEEMDTYIAIIYQPGGDKDLLKDVRLSIADQPDIILNGYMNADTAVYCCVLTEGEMHLIESGADVKLWHEPWYSEEDFNGSEYALVSKETGGYGVINREGKYVLGPGYERAQRYGNTVFLTRTNRNLEVFNLDTMEIIGDFECPSGGYIGIYPKNNAVYAVEISDVWYLYDMQTGKALAVLPINEDESPYYSFLAGGIDGKYYGYQIGYPERLVFWRYNEVEEKDYCWLADNRGKRISENKQRIEPIIWNGDKGVFAVSTYDKTISHPNNDQKYLEGYDGRPYFGEDWRVGLMDEKGKMITNMEYVYIKVLSENEIELHKPDGSIDVIRI